MIVEAVIRKLGSQRPGLQRLASPKFAEFAKQSGYAEESVLQIKFEDSMLAGLPLP